MRVMPGLRGSAASIARAPVASALALLAFGAALAADVPRDKEVVVLHFIPGKLGPVRFPHGDHARGLTRPDGSRIRCKDCHHVLSGDEPTSPGQEMRCGPCHAGLSEPERVVEGRRARPMARLKPDGAIDQRTVLFHDSCRACHQKTRGRGRLLMACKVCHERGISSDVLHGRFDSVPQPGTGLTWLRCPVGQSWAGSRCEGRVAPMDWQQAARSCPEGYRLPSPEELQAILDGCAPGAAARGPPCRPCARSAVCSRLFGADEGAYWTEAAEGDRAWTARLGDGSFRAVARSAEAGARCVKADR